MHKFTPRSASHSHSSHASLLFFIMDPNTGGDGDSLPKDWEPMVDPSSGKDLPLRVIDLPPDSRGYKFAEAEFNKTMVQGRNYSAIVSIQHVQNRALYGQYIAKKKKLDSVNSAGVQNERWLFHGTKADAISHINQTNFNRSLCGQNGI